MQLHFLHTASKTVLKSRNQEKVFLQHLRATEEDHSKDQGLALNQEDGTSLQFSKNVGAGDLNTEDYHHQYTDDQDQATKKMFNY